MQNDRAHVPKRRQLELVEPTDGNKDHAVARLVAEPYLASACAMVDFAEGPVGDVHLSAAIKALKANANAVNRNDLANAEAILSSQASALNVMFGVLATRAAANMGKHLSVTEAYMRMAMKAQNQCRMTLETLATIKNPPTIFARQANITSGPQQVNNGAPVLAGVREMQAVPDKLLEQQHGERLDGGTQGAAGGSNPELETVVAVNRTKDG